MNSKEVIPRRRESGAILTVWMRDPHCFSKARSEGGGWWSDIAPE